MTRQAVAHFNGSFRIQADDLMKIGLFRFWQIGYLAANSKNQTSRG